MGLEYEAREKTLLLRMIEGRVSIKRLGERPITLIASSPRLIADSSAIGIIGGGWSGSVFFC